MNDSKKIAVLLKESTDRIMERIEAGQNLINYNPLYKPEVEIVEKQVIKLHLFGGVYYLKGNHLYLLSDYSLKLVTSDLAQATKDLTHVKNIISLSSEG